MRENFVFYGSFYEAAQKLDGKDRLAFYDAIMEYSLTGKEPEVDGIAGIIFTAIKPVLDTQLQNYKNGKKGGRPKKESPVSNEKKEDNEKEKSDNEKQEKGGFENKKGGFSENEKGAFQKTKSYKDKDKDKDKEKDKDNIYNSFVNLWNKYAERFGLSTIRQLSNKRKKKLKTRLKENDNFLNDFEEALKQVESSSFLRGENKNGWTINFDWLIENDTNYVKVLEGAYNDKNTAERNFNPNCDVPLPEGWAFDAGFRLPEGHFL